MAEFTASVFQNEYLPDGGTDVNAIVTVTCSGAGTAGQTGGGGAGEIIIVDTSGSMGPQTMHAAKQAATAALNEIVDGTWFAVIAGSDRAMLAYPAVSSGPGLVQMDDRTRSQAQLSVSRFVGSGGTAIVTTRANGESGWAPSPLAVIAPQSWPTSIARSSPPSAPWTATASAISDPTV